MLDDPFSLSLSLSLFLLFLFFLLFPPFPSNRTLITGRGHGGGRWRADETVIVFNHSGRGEDGRAISTTG